MTKVRPNGPSNGAWTIGTPSATAFSYKACALLARHHSWIEVASGAGGRVELRANVGQPTNATAFGPKSNESRMAAR